MQSDGNLNAEEEPRQETGNEMNEEKQNDVKTYESEGQAEGGGAGGSGSGSMTKIIIIIAAAIVVIVVVNLFINLMMRLMITSIASINQHVPVTT